MNTLEEAEARIRELGAQLAEADENMSHWQGLYQRACEALKNERERAEKAEADAARLRAALEQANQFITNGVELGYIQMPDHDTPDSAHDTPGIIRAALSPDARQAESDAGTEG